MNDEFEKKEYESQEFEKKEYESQEHNYENSNYTSQSKSKINEENNIAAEVENNPELKTDHVVKTKLEDEAEPRKKHKLIKSFTKLVAAAMVFGLVAGASFQGYNTLMNNDQTSKTSITQNIDKTVTDTSSQDAVAVKTGTNQGNTTSDVSTVVDNVMPSIVAINSVVNQVNSDFFGRQYNQEVKGSGSGIIIGQNDSEILIVTNNHVVEGATSVEIVFSDESKVKATIKGTAANSDLAVVSVNVDDVKDTTLDNIKIATLGDSNSTKLGEMAIAIGNALGYGQSVTVGYISALNREVAINDTTSLKLIQTDAAINPGNSGGALLNTQGEVIGINSVKYVDSSVESIGYAIPISDAIPIINELMNRTVLSETETAYLGIGGKDVTEAYSTGFGMPVGIYVAKISEDSAAEKAGLKVGDIIVSINDIKVETMTDLQDVLSYTKAGSTGTIVVKSLQDGEYKEQTLNITYGSKPATN